MSLNLKCNKQCEDYEEDTEASSKQDDQLLAKSERENSTKKTDAR